MYCTELAAGARIWSELWSAGSPLVPFGVGLGQRFITPIALIGPRDNVPRGHPELSLCVEPEASISAGKILCYNSGISTSAARRIAYFGPGRPLTARPEKTLRRCPFLFSFSPRLNTPSSFHFSRLFPRPSLPHSHLYTPTPCTETPSV